MSKINRAGSLAARYEAQGAPPQTREVVTLGFCDRPGAGRPPRTCLAPAIDPVDEAAYWRDAHHLQRFAIGRFDHADFAPAYRCGVDQFLREPFLSFSKAEVALEKLWPQIRGSSRLPWKLARYASRASWERARSKAHALASEA